MIENEYYIQEYINSRGLSEKTYKVVKTVLNHYSKYQKTPLQKLLEEADQEEEKGIRWKRRTLKIRLTSYMNYCKTSMKLSSAKGYVKTVKGFYTHHEIEIGILPKWNEKNANIPEPIKPGDLPTKEIIRKIVDLADPIMKAIVLFEVSSGMSKVDLRNLSIKSFLDATFSYHQKDNIRDAIEVMMNLDEDIIPTFHMRRQKNNKYFITFCSPEATREIINYLIIRDKRNKKYKRPLLTNDDPLFKIGYDHYQTKFVELNNALNLPKKGSFNQFRGHMLRKFHATQLEKYGMPRYLVKVLQGKSNGNVDDVYFYEDEDQLRKAYVQALEGVLIFTEVNNLDIKSPEFLELESKIKERDEVIEKYQSIVDNIDEVIESKISAALEKSRGPLSSEEMEDLFS